jgi:parallel beta-helix repeat protein
MMTATRLRNCLLTFSVLLLVMQWAAFSAQAQISVTTCGTSITQPGKYILANDLLACAEDGIVIQSAGVYLNLNGHQITGIQRSLTRGIQVTLPPKESVIIDGPGTIARFGMGVDLDLANGRAFIVGVTAEHNRFGFLVLNGSDVTLGNNTAVNNSVIGFALYDTDDSSLVESAANRNGTGISIVGSRNEIILNTTDNNDMFGIVVFRAHNRISSNTALGNSRYDLYQLGQNCDNTWVNNTFKTANLPCIH